MDTMTAFKHLFQPIDIGSLRVKNRLLMSAMSINFGVDERGYVTDQLTEYFLARARGGVGMMLVGGGGIHPDGVELPHLPVLWEDGCLPALKKMTAAMTAHDVVFGMQLMHGGRQSYHDHTVAPSAIPAPALVKSMPRALAVDEIGEIAADFGEAARRCREGGFSFIELHGAHGYLFNQFLAPNANRRTDDYGGSFENRIRFLLEVMAAVRARAGEDFPVGVRINGEDYIENGWTLAEARRLAPLLEEAGAAYIHVSAGVYGSTQLTIPSMYVEQGCFVHLAEAIMPLVNVPVIATGRIKDPHLAEGILARGQADMVAMGRSLLADPDLPDKVRQGRLNEIRPCMGCCVACIHAVFNLEPASCVANPDVGREYLLREEFPPDKRAKRVLVVGGGPGGMAAARMAARRGHQVVLCEQQAFLGGAARLACRPPGRADIDDFLRFQQCELGRLKVEVRLNTPLSADLLAGIEPEVVILASGGLSEVPLIKGLLTTSLAVHIVEDIMAAREVAGERVVVAGGNQIGLLAADYLAAKGRRVAVLHRGRHFAEEMSGNDRYYLRESLKKHGVSLHKKVTIREVTERGVGCRVGGQARSFDCDSLVIADMRTALREALGLLKDKSLEVYTVGDAKSPRTIQFAVSEAEEVGRGL